MREVISIHIGQAGKSKTSLICQLHATAPFPGALGDHGGPAQPACQLANLSTRAQARLRD